MNQIVKSYIIGIVLTLQLKYLIVFLLISANSSWNIVTGVCVERLPIVTPPLNEIQKKFKDLLWTIEVENSLKSNHEIRHENDK